MLQSIQRHRDRYAGGLMICLGLGTIVQSSQYGVGTLAAIGPGFFPLAMGVILVACGIAIALSPEDGETGDHRSGTALDHDRVDLSQPEWRGWLCIIGGLLGFLLLAKTAGLFPATFTCVFVSALGDRSTTLRGAAALALGIAIFGCLLFYYGLHIQLPPFAWVRS